MPCGRLSWLLVRFWAHVNIVVGIGWLVKPHGGRGSAPDPAGEFTAFPMDSVADGEGLAAPLQEPHPALGLRASNLVTMATRFTPLSWNPEYASDGTLTE